jgi:selenoprotein W-related protein
VSLTAEILKDFEGQTESLELVPSSGGAFEIDVDGVRVFSKLKADRFPAAGEVKKAIREKVVA